MATTATLLSTTMTCSNTARPVLFRRKSASLVVGPPWKDTQNTWATRWMTVRLFLWPVLTVAEILQELTISPTTVCHSWSVVSKLTILRAWSKHYKRSQSKLILSYRTRTIKLKRLKNIWVYSLNKSDRKDCKIDCKISKMWQSSSKSWIRNSKTSSLLTSSKSKHWTTRLSRKSKKYRLRRKSWMQKTKL